MMKETDFEPGSEADLEEPEEDMEAQLKNLLSLSLDEIFERVADKIARRSEVVEVRRFGPLLRTVYRDGRETVHSYRRYPGEPGGYSPYDAMQLGQEVKELYPRSPLPPWTMTVLGTMPLLAASLLGMLKPRSSFGSSPHFEAPPSPEQTP